MVVPPGLAVTLTGRDGGPSACSPPQRHPGRPALLQPAARDHRLRARLDEERFAALNACADPGEDFVRIVENLINNDPRSTQ